MILAAIATLMLATLSRVGVVLAGASGGYLYYATTSRCDSLALGILLALFAHRLPKLTRGMRFLLLAGGLIGWIVSSAWLIELPGPVSMRWALGRLIVSLASGAILYGCLHSRSKLLRGDGVVRLGKISYGLYLLHPTGILIMLSLFHPIWGWKMLATKALGLAMTVILGFASYRWVESPFLRLKDRFARVLSRPV
jgi:peptidoglycan/LPS O-acetylase OafA/YrhL